ncbi:MAG: hypothetical protein M5R36_22635 [Deltaproteobacteria bacterium]|nr:hypothetical protein [Deltaproteobacteria bacterium]
MKNAFLTLAALLLLSLLFVWSCSSGDTKEEDKPPCPAEIIDEDYDGPQHLVMGIGMGGPTALDLALDNPEFFAAAATLGGPVDLRLLLTQIRARLADFDNWPALPKREDYLAFLRDVFIAYGNPCYDNPASQIYPPGTTGLPQQVVPHFVDALNPDGSDPAVTFVDGENEFPVTFLLALDENDNGLRDVGEPIALSDGRTLCRRQRQRPARRRRGL